MRRWLSHLAPAMDLARRRGGLRFWIFASVLLTGLFAFLEVADEIIEMTTEGEQEVRLLDEKLMAMVAEWRGPALNQVMTDLTSLGSYSVLIVISVLALVFLSGLRDTLGRRQFLIVLIGSAFIPKLLKLIFNRDRPSLVPPLAVVSDSSFPSGHSFGAASIYLTLAFLASQHRPGISREFFYTLLAVGIILIVGFSRIYLGVHYPTDVFAGMCAGGTWSLTVALIFIPAYRRRLKTNAVGR